MLNLVMDDAAAADSEDNDDNANGHDSTDGQAL